MIRTGMGILAKIKRYFTLRRAAREEQKKMPTDRDILLEQKEFLKETKELRGMVTKK